MLAVRAEADIERTERLARSVGDQKIFHLGLERRPLLLQLEPLHLLLSPFTEERAVDVRRGPRRFAITSRSDGRTAAVFADARQMPIRMRVIVVGITVVAGRHVMREPSPPAESVIGVVVSENVVERIHRYVEMVTRPRRNDLQLRTIRPHANDAAPFERDGTAVAADRLRNSLVTDGNVNQSVQPQSRAGDDVIVEAVHTGGRPEACREVFTNIGDTVSVRVFEHREMRRVHDVERVVVPHEPEHGGEVVAEDCLPHRLPIGTELDEEDSVELLRRRPAHIHRVFPDEQIPVVIAGHDGRGFDVGNSVEQFHLEVRRHDFLSE